jgi:TetR/AcrR family transcriptional repressor of nem operon
MSRNKYPEQTVEQILAISTTLFNKNGYEKTTIQDILNELKMSKGAIYHHFKSKEDILNAIIERRSSYAKELLNRLIVNTKAENAKEKLKKIILEISKDKENHSIDTILSSQIKNPQFVVAGIQASVIDDAQIISKLFIEGREDGSIKTEYPLECSEVFMLLINIWINPVIYSRSIEETKQRLIVLQNLMKQLGADIITDEIIDIFVNDYKNMNAFKN